MPKLWMQNGDVNKMLRENYWRISHGYEPHEPTNTFSFYKRKPVLKENLIFALLKETNVLSFLSTGSFFQTLGKFNQQTFSKSLSKNASQLRRKKVLGKSIWRRISGKLRKKT